MSAVMQMVLAATQGGKRHVSFVTSAIADDASIVVPPEAAVGDLAVLIDSAIASNIVVANAVYPPAGWLTFMDTIFNYGSSIGSRQMPLMSYKVLTAADLGATLAGYNTVADVGSRRKMLLIFRGTHAFDEKLVVQGIVSSGSAGDPAAISIPAGATPLQYPIISVASYRSAAAITRSHSPAEDGEIAAGAAFFVRYKIFNDESAVNIAADVNDGGASNTVIGFYFKEKDDASTYTYTTQNLMYGVNARHRVRMYRPRGIQGKIPSICLIHGGDWNSGDENQLDYLAERYAGFGYAVGAMTYRLAPGSTHPAQLNDVSACVDYMKTLDYVDPNRMCAWGHSAGGFMAAWMGVIPGKVKCTVLNWAACDPTLYVTTGVTMLGGANPSAASPIVNMTAAARPTFMGHGTNDTTVVPQHSLNFKNALDVFEVPNERYTYPDDHLEPAEPYYSILRGKELAFLRTYL